MGFGKFFLETRPWKLVCFSLRAVSLSKGLDTGSS